MLSTILTLKEGRNTIVSKGMGMHKEIFRDRPALPHYAIIYDTRLVIVLLKSLPTWNVIGLKCLRLKI